jgi:membrane-bound lytic murein transglycosylase D
MFFFVAQPAGRSWRCVAACAVLLVAAMLAPAWAEPADATIPRPAELERDVQFWIRVYTEVSTNEGFLHDEHHLGVIYQKVHFDPDLTQSERHEQLDGLREQYRAMLRRLAQGATDLTEEEERIRTMFGSDASSARFAQAAEEVRFQLGQADRFREGLVRSGTWESHIAETLANLGLPPELSVLPHVESSFNPSAYSKVGAAGLWQFMRSTGRRFLRIDDAVDERLDPFRATEAAAQLLDFNYRLLGTWPLALTAYNHGAAGMRRARDAMGTSDIVPILRQHHSPTFGFASRNFYVSFLAALEIDRHPENYFGAIERQPESHFHEMEMPAFVPVAALERVLKIDRSRLEALNPALLPSVWKGQRRVPQGYRLRLPDEAGDWTTQKLAARLAPSDRFAGQPQPSLYRVKEGETLASIARDQGYRLEELASTNGLKPGARVKKGRTLRLPQALALTSRSEPEPAVDKAPAPAKTVEPPPSVDSESPTKASGEASSPTVPPKADPIDYAVAADGTVRVAATETLGHYADWLKVSAARLRELNGMKPNAAIAMGRKLRLQFDRVPQAQFEQRRYQYHQQLQAAYFAGHRIVGTETYLSRPGDSLWTVTQRFARLPVWLLQQYNPDLDFSALKAGVSIVVPKVEEVPVV